jgi:hypothetical protein
MKNNNINNQNNGESDGTGINNNNYNQSDEKLKKLFADRQAFVESYFIISVEDYHN